MRLTTANRIASLLLSETCFGTEFQEPSIFSMEGIPSIFLLCGTVRNIIFRVSCFAEWFRMEFRDFASIFVQLYRAFFSSKEWFGTEFRKFSVLRNSQNSAGTKHLFRLFRLPRNNFLSELAISMASLFLTRGFAALQAK